MKKEILLFSGGIDSLCAYFYLNKPKCLYVKLGHKYQDEELKAVKNIAEKYDIDLEIEEMEFIGKFEEDDANIPMRNLFLSMIASFYADKIWLIVQKGETGSRGEAPDRTKDFFVNTSLTLSILNKRNIEIDSPFWNLTKQDLVQWVLDNVEDSKEILSNSFSCFNPIDGKQCGKCSACFRQFISLAYNGIDVKDRMVHDITKWDGIKNYVKKMKDGQYEEERTKQTKKVLKRYGLWQ